MDLENIYFYGTLNHIKKLEEFLKELPEKTILHKDTKKPHNHLEVKLERGQTASIYPNYSVPIQINVPSEAVVNSKYVEFNYKNVFYRIFFEKPEEE